MRTIRSNKEIDALFRKGVRVSGPLMIVLASTTPQERGPQGRVAFVAGKRLGNAVTRNRAKRVLRAAVSRLGGPWHGYDVVLIARPATTTARAGELDRALEAALQRIGVRA